MCSLLLWLGWEGGTVAGGRQCSNRFSEQFVTAGREKLFSIEKEENSSATVIKGDAFSLSHEELHVFL